jgi:hypothetical protein
MISGKAPISRKALEYAAVADHLRRLHEPAFGLPHDALLSHGTESVLVIYPQEGHGVRAYPAVTDCLTRSVGWFERHMPAGTA